MINSDYLMVLKIFLKGTSPEGQRLNKEVAQQLEGLNSEMQHAILQQEQSGVRRPANTFVGKMDQVHQWMNNPSSDPTGLGGCPVLVCSRLSVAGDKQKKNKASGRNNKGGLRLRRKGRPFLTLVLPHFFTCLLSCFAHTLHREPGAGSVHCSSDPLGTSIPGKNILKILEDAMKLIFF